MRTGARLDHDQALPVAGNLPLLAAPMTLSSDLGAKENVSCFLPLAGERAYFIILGYFITSFNLFHSKRFVPVATRERSWPRGPINPHWGPMGSYLSISNMQKSGLGHIGLCD